jgi:alpha/beta superfamily hydrolase
MRQQSIGFRSGKLTLEGIVTIPPGDSGDCPGVIVCHAHPVLGGNMTSDVMHAICQSLDDAGIATFRFNFRGVGGSEGSFDQGKGEQNDLKSAFDTFRKWPGVEKNSVGVAGISFGAVVALDFFNKHRGQAALAVVSPTVAAMKRARLDKLKGGKLLVAGGLDRMAPADELISLAVSSQGVECRMISGADHTWASLESELARQMTEFFTAELR